MSAHDPDLATLEGHLAHSFRERALLVEALTHRSYCNEASDAGPDNERLEFLGDAVLQLCISSLLFARGPDLREGRLSLIRSQVVNEGALCQVAERIELGRYLRLGRGEELTGGRGKASLLADACEAVMGAVYLDGGYAAAHAIVERLLGEAVTVALGSLHHDFKSRLQEVLQARSNTRPRYQVVATQGPEHLRIFVVEVFFEDQLLAQAEGRSKREAEQRAAEGALQVLGAR